jgi:two-component system chemotaxis response regulator CheB
MPSDEKIKVLPVDDSGLMRLIVADMLNSEPDIEVCDTAENGKEAFEKTLELRPDVVILDLMMQDYDGLYAVEHIMKKCPTPIVILSALGNADPKAVLKALDAGAYDFVNKPQSTVSPKIREVKDELIEKVRNANGTEISEYREFRKRKSNSRPHTFIEKLPYSLIVMGSSTGGTAMVEKILMNLPENIPVPIFAAQHMPEQFVESFAARLAGICSLEVKVAEHKEVLKPGCVYIAPGNRNVEIKKIRTGDKITVQYTDKQFKEYNNPSVDCLMLSAAQALESAVIGVILTGMGRDGTEGMKALHEKEAYTIVQDEATSINERIKMMNSKLWIIKEEKSGHFFGRAFLCSEKLFFLGGAVLV